MFLSVFFFRNSLQFKKVSLPLQPQTRNNGAIAQLVEQRTENPCVPGSIPGGTTFQKQSECSAVGSALRSGRRGRAFESPHSDTVKDKRVYRNERCTPFFIMPYSNQLTEMKTYPRIMRKDYSRILARFQKVTFFPTIVVGILIQVLPDPAPSSVKSCAKFCLTTSLFQ